MRHKEQEHYGIRAVCTNCGYIATVWFKRGVEATFFSKECYYCGCKKLVSLQNAQPQPHIHKPLVLDEKPTQVEKVVKCLQ